MKEIDDCKIVQDLLPNYIENLTNEETNKYIEKHLKECSKCKKILEDMKKDLEIDTKKREKREVKYIKKFSKKMRVLKIIILLILIIFMIEIGRKSIIISKLSNNADNYINSTNYHRITYSYNMGNYSKVEIFSLGDKKEMIATKITDEGKSTRKMFAKKISSENKDDDRYLTNIYIEEEGKKTAQLNKNVGISVDPQNTLYTDNWWQLIINSIPATVKKATFNGEECYYIHNFQTPYSLSERGGIYINKKTGLPISTMAYEYTNSDGTRRKMASRRIYIRI